MSTQGRHESPASRPRRVDVARLAGVSNSSQTFPISADGSYTYTLPSGTSAMFTTESLSSFPTPAFGTLTPSQGIPGYEFSITGSHFGATQGLGTVYFGSTHAKIDSWSDTSISAYVPTGLPSGTYRLP